jgi:hypothetical protein
MNNMSDAQMYLTAVSTVGFPIVAFCMMFWFATTIVRSNTTAITELKTTIKTKKE